MDARAAARSSPSGLTEGAGVQAGSLDARARYKVLELSEGVLKEGLAAPFFGRLEARGALYGPRLR